MNSSTENSCSRPPSAATESCTASSRWSRMNSWTDPSGSLKSSITSWASKLVPNVSLIVVTVSVMYVSESDSRSAICEPTSVPMATTNTRNMANTPNRSSAVAVPRRQPRRARRLTPGSRASDRNTEMARRTKSPFSLPQKKRTARAARNPPQNTATPGSTQRGSRRDSEGVASGTVGSTSPSTPSAGRRCHRRRRRPARTGASWVVTCGAYPAAVAVRGRRSAPRRPCAAQVRGPHGRSWRPDRAPASRPSSAARRPG